MSTNALLLDTYFVIALLNPRDHSHRRARDLWPTLHSAREVWVTEAILIEVGNAFSASDRDAAYAFITQCYRLKNFRVINVTTDLLSRALELYHSRQDKNWGLTDCISFVVMQDHDLTDALTADKHFQQAGFRPLLLDKA